MDIKEFAWIAAAALAGVVLNELLDVTGRLNRLMSGNQ